MLRSPTCSEAFKETVGTRVRKVAAEVTGRFQREMSEKTADGGGIVHSLAENDGRHRVGRHGATSAGGAIWRFPAPAKPTLVPVPDGPLAGNNTGKGGAGPDAHAASASKSRQNGQENCNSDSDDDDDDDIDDDDIDDETRQILEKLRESLDEETDDEIGGLMGH